MINTDSVLVQNVIGLFLVTTVLSAVSSLLPLISWFVKSVRSITTDGIASELVSGSGSYCDEHKGGADSCAGNCYH